MKDFAGKKAATFLKKGEVAKGSGDAKHRWNGHGGGAKNFWNFGAGCFAHPSPRINKVFLLLFLQKKKILSSPEHL
jgi:hypothetical protein